MYSRSDFKTSSSTNKWLFIFLGESMDISKISVEEDHELLYLTVGLYKLFLTYGKLGDTALNVFLHLFFTARIQHTNQVRATNKYIQNGKKIGEASVIRAKKLLVDLGLIEYIRTKDEKNKYEKVYIKLKPILPQEKLNEMLNENSTPINSTVVDGHCSGKKGTKCLNVKSKCLNVKIEKCDLQEQVTCEKQVSHKESLSNKIEHNKNEYIKKQLSYEDIDPILKYMLDSYYERVIIIHPKIKKESFYDPIEIYKCNEILKFIKNGSPNGNQSTLKLWMEKQKNSSAFCSMISQGMTDEKIKEIFDIALLVFDQDYFPDNKTVLPNRLSGFLYNERVVKLPSHFYCYGLIPPIKKSTSTKIEDPLSATGVSILRNSFEQSSFSESEKNKLIKNCNLVEKEFRKQLADIIVAHKGSDLELFSLFGDIGDNDSFYSLYADWIEDRNHYLQASFNSEVAIDMIKPGTKTWNAFIEHLNEKYKIEFYPTKLELMQSKKMQQLKVTHKVQEEIVLLPWEAGSE